MCISAFFRFPQQSRPHTKQRPSQPAGHPAPTDRPAIPQWVHSLPLPAPSEWRAFLSLCLSLPHSPAAPSSLLLFFPEVQAPLTARAAVGQQRPPISLPAAAAAAAAQLPLAPVYSGPVWSAPLYPTLKSRLRRPPVNRSLCIDDIFVL